MQPYHFFSPILSANVLSGTTHGGEQPSPPSMMNYPRKEAGERVERDTSHGFRGRMGGGGWPLSAVHHKTILQSTLPRCDFSAGKATNVSLSCAAPELAPEFAPLFHSGVNAKKGWSRS